MAFTRIGKNIKKQTKRENTTWKKRYKKNRSVKNAAGVAMSSRPVTAVTGSIASGMLNTATAPHRIFRKAASIHRGH